MCVRGVRGGRGERHGLRALRHKGATPPRSPFAACVGTSALFQSPPASLGFPPVLRLFAPAQCFSGPRALP